MHPDANCRIELCLCAELCCCYGDNQPYTEMYYHKHDKIKTQHTGISSHKCSSTRNSNTGQKAAQLLFESERKTTGALESCSLVFVCVCVGGRACVPQAPKWLEASGQKVRAFQQFVPPGTSCWWLYTAPGGWWGGWGMTGSWQLVLSYRWWSLQSLRRSLFLSGNSLEQLWLKH